MTQLTILDQFPPEALECAATDLHRHFSGPTLIHLPGERPEPLFVSVLLHGNETTGWEAMRALLRKFRDRPPPRALSLFLGNIEAARRGVRRLDEQLDFNRVWPLADSAARPNELAEPPQSESAAQDTAKIMAQVVAEMRARACFASIDIHNTTGSNPHYGCVNKLDGAFLNLARLFSRTVIYFLRPLGVQSAAFAEFCPAVTIECGKAEGQTGIRHAMDFVETVLHLKELAPQRPPAREYDLYHTVAVVKVPESTSFRFQSPAATQASRAAQSDLIFDGDLDRWNFRELAHGTVFGNAQGSARLAAWDETGREVGAEFFEYRDAHDSHAAGVREIRLKKAVMPSMLTVDPEIVRQDCLGYFMERLEHPAEAAPEQSQSADPEDSRLPAAAQSPHAG